MEFASCGVRHKSVRVNVLGVKKTIKKIGAGDPEGLGAGWCFTWEGWEGLADPGDI